MRHIDSLVTHTVAAKNGNVDPVQHAVRKLSKLGLSDINWDASQTQKNTDGSKTHLFSYHEDHGSGMIRVHGNGTIDHHFTENPGTGNWGSTHKLSTPVHNVDHHIAALKALTHPTVKDHKHAAAIAQKHGFQKVKDV